ncbi:Transcriptional regulator [Seminavis robusta]|uniref:Transcriptional regulator n=1 Tax=Seminavis robusta TaxID=568900 RepID=A0A9N8H2M5_9STRA|nr:Transcriptional regulator [Seminavis robusta]|eukprot:Sro68_g038260.1 Transcriptional regulator (1373) ;mRNA; r:94671-99138
MDTKKDHGPPAVVMLNDESEGSRGQLRERINCRAAMLQRAASQQSLASVGMDQSSLQRRRSSFLTAGSSQQRLMFHGSHRSSMSYLRSSVVSIKSAVAQLIEEDEIDEEAADFALDAGASSSEEECTKSFCGDEPHHRLDEDGDDDYFDETATTGPCSRTTSSQMQLEEILAEKTSTGFRSINSEPSIASLASLSQASSRGSSWSLAAGLNNSGHNKTNGLGTTSGHSQPRISLGQPSQRFSMDASLGATSSRHSRFIKPESSKLRALRALADDQETVTSLSAKWSKLGLFGRNDHVKQLQACLSQWESANTIKDNNQQPDQRRNSQVNNNDDNKRLRRNLVWLSGASGTGKSSLADHALSTETAKHRQGGLYVKGKFDSQSRNSERPFVGFAAACDDLCVQLLASKSQQHERYAKLQESLQQDMSKDEAVSLLRLIPGLGPILEALVPKREYQNLVSKSVTKGSLRYSTIGRYSTNSQDGAPDMMEAEQTPQEAQHQFHFVFRHFIRLVSDVFPLVLVLDDLQWADSGSLELLEVLILDEAITKLILVGCYRDDEVGHKHALARLQREANSMADEWGLRVEDIKVGNLSVDDLNLLMADLLDLEPTQTKPLTETCHKKTGGNPFYFSRFVTMLWKEKHLQYDLLAYKWTWNDEDIANCSGATENVVNFLRNRLVELPHNTQQLLLFASCLGAEFDEKMISLVMDDFYPGAGYQDDLKCCIEEGVLEKCTVSNKYRWCHDKLIEAAQTLLEEEDLVKLKFCLGAVMLKSLGEQRLEDNLFVVTNLLNEAPSLAEMPNRLADLNLRAAAKAASLSAFDAAADYCNAGIELLRSEYKWNPNQFYLTLQLHSTAAEMHAILGDFNEMEKHCYEVLNRQDVDVLDKVRLHEILMDSICYRDRVSEAREMCRCILKQLGVPFPKSAIAIIPQVLFGLIKAKTKSEKRCKEISNLQFVQGGKHKAVTRLMIKLCKYSLMTNSLLLPLGTLRGDAYSRKNGLTIDTPVNTACLGMMIAAFVGDIQTGSKYALLALDLVDRLPTNHILAEVSFLSYGFVLHHTKPVHELLKPLLRGYDLALQTGNTEHACYNIYFYLLLALRSGKNLHAIQTDLRAYTKQIDQMQIDKPLVFSKMLWQMTMNLMGFAGTKPLTLTGEAMDETSFLQSHSDDAYYYTQFQAHQNHLYAVFGEHQLGAKLALSKDDILPANPGTPYVVMDTFYCAVSLFAMARKTKRRKYVARAKKLKSKIDGWAKDGDPNVVHFHMFLEAESSALKGKPKEAATRYEAAIVTSSRHGFIQDAAMANERLGEMLETELKDESSAAFRFQEAIRLYGEWGAQRKVMVTREQKAHLLNQLSTLNDHPNHIILVHQESSKSVGTT